MTTQTKCGFVAVIGAPNAGKSTLINALVGAKVTITSPKVQTTRMPVRGIMTENNLQAIFIDTPGMFKPKGGTFDEAMVASAIQAQGEADLVFHLVDVSKKSPLKLNQDIIRQLPDRRPVALILNKVDTIQKENLLKLTADLNAAHDYKATFMISALKQTGLKEVVRYLEHEMPAGPWHFDEDEITDMPMRMLAAELTREQVFHQLGQELPYATFVETEKWENFDNGDIKIHQIVYIERDSQKAIVLGKGGSRIKKIGARSRAELEEITGKKVHLKLFVKTLENWQDKAEFRRALGL